MPDQSSSQPKPVTDWWRPELVALSPLTFMRKLTRAFLRGLVKLIAFLLLRMEIKGLEEFPRQGPALIVFNHLGDADVVLLAAAFPIYLATEGIGKIDLYDHWLVGPLFRAYGVIWIHRGQPDRKAIRAALGCLEQGAAHLARKAATVTGGWRKHRCAGSCHQSGRDRAVRHRTK